MGEEANETSPSVPPDKAWKRKAKKLRKKAQNGEISTQEQLRECEKYGIMVKPEVEWASSGEGAWGGKATPRVDADMARDAIVFLLTGKGSQPKWLTLKNLGLVSRVVVVGLSGVDCQSLTKNLSQLPFLNACSTPRPVSYYRGFNPRRMLYSLLFYPPPKGQGNGEADDDEDEDDETSLKGWEAGEPPNDLGLDPVEKFVLTPSQLKLWGYLIPPGEVDEEERGGVERSGEDEDLGECMEQPCTTKKIADTGHPSGKTCAALAWLEAEDEGLWSPSLVPPLEEAKTMLATLPTICQATSEHESGQATSPESAPHPKPKYYYQTVSEAEGQAPLPYKMAAMDCEMCQTAEGNEVTRVTVVDENKRVLLDSFIKPYSPITDYHTKYSGITAEIMDKCDTRLEQVQVALLRLIRAGTILVGHSLEQDLLVTRIIHLRCIDTSIIYPHPRGNQRRFALRVLTKKYLKRVIQDSRHGHCSEEDAVAALELVQLKVERGADFGVEGAPGEDVKGRDSILDVLHQHGRRSALLDESENLIKCVRGQTAAIVCRSNEDTLHKFRSQTNLAVPPHFIFASLQATKPPTIQSAQARRKRRQHEEEAAAFAPPFPKKQKVLPSTPAATSFVLGKGKHTTFEYDESIMEMVDGTLLRTDQILAEMFEALPPNTLMLVLTQPDLTLPFQLTRQRMACQDVRAISMWRPEDEKLLNELSDEGKTGQMFFRVR